MRRPAGGWGDSGFMNIAVGKEHSAGKGGRQAEVCAKTKVFMRKSMWFEIAPGAIFRLTVRKP